jgi:hypothetical protein
LFTVVPVAEAAPCHNPPPPTQSAEVGSEPGSICFRSLVLLTPATRLALSVGRC